MVSMYSLGMMNSMYGMYGSYNCIGGNAHQQLKARYGVGPGDFGGSVYVHPSNFVTVQQAPESHCIEKPICRFFKKCFKNG